MIVAIAEESRGAEHARQWIEAAKAEYWCLIDTDHRVADLYGMVNVPQSVWIDETGRMVRPPETTGSTDHFRRMDLKTRTMAPEDQAARNAARVAYLDADKAWATTGAHALPADAARRRLPANTPNIAQAHAHFRLGVWLRAQGVNGLPVGEGDAIWIGSQILVVTKKDGRWALEHHWAPVGSGLMPAAETRHLVRHLLGDEAGREAVERIDRRIASLPGMDGLAIVAGARAEMLVAA